jgi:hypothetical protein
MLASVTDETAKGSTLSAQVLFAKASFVLYALAITITLSTVGVDLTSLTSARGGRGRWLRLQKIFANLVPASSCSWTSPSSPATSSRWAGCRAA